MVPIMGRKKLSTEEKSRALTMIQCGFSITRVAADLHVFRQALHDLKRAAARLPSCRTPHRKCGIWTQEEDHSKNGCTHAARCNDRPINNGCSTEKKHVQLLQNVSVRTIQHRLQKDLKMPCRRAAKKPLLTKAMMKKRVSVCKKYMHWTIADRRKVMFSDESTFRLVRGGYKLVRRPQGVSRYASKFTIKTVKHLESVMVWGAFSGNKGRGGLYFLPKNVTMRGDKYLRVLDQHMLPFWDIHQCNHFMQDGAPAHRSKVVKKWLKDNHMPVLEWPGNSPDLNPIKNAWNYMKNKVQEAQPTNINSLKEVLTKLWIHMDAEYFKKLAESMPNRLRKVIQAKGHMTKY